MEAVSTTRPLSGASSVITATAAPAKVATPEQRARIAKTAQALEASFMSSMFAEMFQGVKTSAPFGGGDGEAAFQSFLTDAMGKAVAKRGGVGLSRAISQEMLKMQGLS